MPLPIRKVKDEVMMQESQKFDLDNLLPFLQLSPFLILGMPQSNPVEKKALKELWLHSEDIGEDKIRISAKIPQQDVSMLRAKGFLKGDGNVAQFTELGKKALKEAILNDEQSAFTKEASKSLISKNSYDFGEDVLVRINHPEKFGARYITIPKRAIKDKKMSPKKIESYKIATRSADGSYRDISEYTEEDLVSVLHLAKSIIKNASILALAGEKPQYIPVNRLKEFSELIIEELNSR